MEPELLGDIVTWDHPSNEVAYTDLLESLRKADLPPDAAPELSPRSAFSRACKSLKENRQIDRVSVDDATREAKFQLTRVDEISGELRFLKEAFAYLNLDTGAIRCDDSEIEQQAQKLFQTAMGVRTSSDVTKIVQHYFRANGDLFPLNRKGVAYFVPAKFADFTAKIESFFTALGGTFGRFPVPKGTQIGNQSVKEAIDTGLLTMASELEAAVDSWDASTRPATMQKKVEELQALFFKNEAYAEYLGAKKEQGLATLATLKEKLAAKILAVGELKEAVKEEKKAAKAAEKDANQPLLESPATDDEPAEFPDFAIA